MATPQTQSIAELPTPPEVVEYATSARNLGSAAAVVLVVLIYAWLRRRSPDTDLQEHEITKRHAITALAQLAERKGSPSSPPPSQPPEARP